MIDIVIDDLAERDRIRRQLRAKQADCDHECIECPDVLKLIEEDPHRVLILDTETTGLDSYDDDVIELAIIDGAANVLLTQRYDSWKESWDDASNVNHIWPEDVRGKPTLEADVDMISEIISRAHVVVGYNISFDLSFLFQSGVRFHDFKICDVMEEFAEVYGDWNSYWESYTWKKLIVAARHYGIDPTGAHGALRDCQMTLEVLKRIATEPEEIRHRRRGHEYASRIPFIQFLPQDMPVLFRRDPLHQ